VTVMTKEPVVMTKQRISAVAGHDGPVAGPWPWPAMAWS
jgi:hypothetical protein